MRSNKKAIFLMLGAMVLGTAQARDEAMMFPMDEVIQFGLDQGKLNGDVKFYMSGAKTPAVSRELGEDVANKKTNGFNKDDATACRWAALSALIAFQNSALQRGANAVVDLHSYYKKVPVKNPTNYECHAGNFVVGVTLKGTYAKLK